MQQKHFKNIKKYVTTIISVQKHINSYKNVLLSGDPLRTLSQVFKIGYSSSREIMLEVCQAIVDIMLKEYIRVTMTLYSKSEIFSKFGK